MKKNELSIQLIRASMWLYVIWLLLPAVQTTGGAAAGAACVALFGAGVLLDTNHLQKHWPGLLARAACAAVMPLLWWFFAGRGAAFAGFYVQHAMFWFPLVFAGYAREKGDARLWKWLRWVLLAAVTVTVLTTIGWLIQGMLRGGRVYAYSRSLGYAGEGREAYLKELMLRNIGGYDFVYAMAAALPLTCIGIQRHHGWPRAGSSVRKHALVCSNHENSQGSRHAAGASPTVSSPSSVPSPASVAGSSAEESTVPSSVAAGSVTCGGCSVFCRWVPAT